MGCFTRTRSPVRTRQETGFCCCLCSFPLQFIWYEFYDVVRWWILTNHQTNMSDVVLWLGYLAFTQEAWVRLPASEMLFSTTTLLPFRCFSTSENVISLFSIYIWFYGVMVSTQDSESCDPSLSLGRT